MSKFNDDEISWSAPSSDCPCANCVNKMPGFMGYRNIYCKAYSDDPGKPTGILFDNEPCAFYKSE